MSIINEQRRNIRRILNGTLEGKTHCQCPQTTVKKLGIYPPMVRAARIQSLVNSHLGGRTVFAESQTNYLGLGVGQIGGSGAPIRNRFY